MFLKAYRDKVTVTTGHDTFGGERENKGRVDLSRLFVPPHHQEKNQNPLRKQNRLKQSVVRTGAILMTEGWRRVEGGGKSLTEGILGRRNAEVPRDSKRRKKREENKMQSR